MPTQISPNVKDSIIYELEDVGTVGCTYWHLYDNACRYIGKDIEEKDFRSLVSSLVSTGKIFFNPGKIYTIRKNKFEIPYQKPV